MTPKFLTNREAQKRIAELEALVAKGPGPTNAAPDPASRAKVALALQAKTDAAKAALAAAEAKARAKSAVEALKPAALAVQMAAAPIPPGLSPSERRAFAKSQATMTPANARTFSDSYLHTAAVSKFSPPAEAAIAKAEMEARGYVFHGTTVSKSHR